MSPRADRRFWYRAERLRKDHNVSLKLAAAIAREDDRLARKAVRQHTPPAELVREIREGVRERAVRS